MEKYSPELDDEILERTNSLFEREENDIYSILGIQSEQLDINVKRLEQGRQIPFWNDDLAYTKVISAQRASLEDLHKYATKGKLFAEKLLNDAADQLRLKLCDGDRVRPEIDKFENDTKSLLKELSSVIIGATIVNLPAALVGAVASISATLAVIVIKGKIASFCKSGFEPNQQ